MCSADNGLGQVNKAELSLDVLYAPVATLPPKREVKEGENVEVECKIASNPRPATIQVRNFNCTLHFAFNFAKKVQGVSSGSEPATYCQSRVVELPKSESTHPASTSR